MPDDKQNVGKVDRDRVSADEVYEVNHLARKFGVSTAVVTEAIRKHGPMRKSVEQALQQMSTQGPSSGSAHR